MKPLKLILFCLPFCIFLFGSCKNKCSKGPEVYLDSAYKNYIPYHIGEQLVFYTPVTNDTQILTVNGFQTSFDEMADYAAEGPCPSSHQYESYCCLINGNKHNYKLWVRHFRGDGMYDPSKKVLYFYFNEQVESALQAQMGQKTINGKETVDITEYMKTDSMLVGSRYYYQVFKIDNYWKNYGILYNKEFGLLKIWEGNQELIRVLK